MTRRRTQGAKILPGIAAAIGLILGSGCANFNHDRGEGFRDGKANWAESLRLPGPQGELSGLTEEARDIERNLGVR